MQRSYRLDMTETIKDVITDILVSEQILTDKDFIMQLIQSAYFESKQAFYPLVVYANVAQQQNYVVTVKGEGEVIGEGGIVIIIVLPLQESYLTIKQTDSLLRRMQKGIVQFAEFQQ